MKREIRFDEKRAVALSNLGKVFYPETGFTKGEVLDYYVAVAPYLLPHLKNRPLTLKRYPDGVNGNFFYEKRCPPYRPDWIKTVDIAGEKSGQTVNFCVINDLASLVWAVNLADLEMHTSLSPAESVERPTAMVFDLDPGPPAGLIEAGEIALLLRRVLADLGLESHAKTSGLKGVQVYVPLNTAVDYRRTKTFARAAAKKIESFWPDKAISVMNKTGRSGRVFIDWSQNDRHKTTVTVYSLRAAARPSVSAPVGWEELERAVNGKDPSRLMYGPAEVVERVKKSGDIFEPVLKVKQALPYLS